MKISQCIDLDERSITTYIGGKRTDDCRTGISRSCERIYINNLSTSENPTKYLPLQPRSVPTRISLGTMLRRLLTHRFRSPQFLFPRIKNIHHPGFTETLPVTTGGYATNNQTVPQPSERHISVDPEEITRSYLNFIEEPLGFRTEQGHGFIRIQFGDTIGPDHRYKVVRKLGWGTNSSVWMAFDGQYVMYNLELLRILC